MNNSTLLAILAVAVPSLIQISPLKLKPWDILLEWLGNKLYGKRLEQLEKQVEKIWIVSHRSIIIEFAKECRNQVSHTYDEWQNILNIMSEYKYYCTKHNIPNGIIEAETNFLQTLYHELSKKGELNSR